MTNARTKRVSTRAALWAATTLAFGALMVVIPTIAAADPGDGVDPSGTAGASTSQSIVPRSLGDVRRE